MRNTVTFRHPASFEPLSEEEGILGVGGARWFVDVLRKIPDLEIEDELVQEDWGVVVFAKRGGRTFWIGLSSLGEHEWIAHVHHGSMAWLQRLTSSGKAARRALIAELERVLRESRASSLSWFEERDVNLRNPADSCARS